MERKEVIDEIKSIIKTIIPDNSVIDSDDIEKYLFLDDQSEKVNDSLNLSSLEYIEVILEAETRFNISIDENRIINILSFNDLVDCVVEIVNLSNDRKEKIDDIYNQFFSTKV